MFFTLTSLKFLIRWYIANLFIILRQVGLSDLLISWITAFLTDRSQQVRIENVISHMSKVICGVPHGSVLGPILFIILVNDLEDVLSNKATLSCLPMT